MSETMESRQLRKVRVGYEADKLKWLDQRKVDIGVIFESWRSLRKIRADTDPGLAFHLMEIHDRHCFCRFEESQSTFREGDMVVSSDVSDTFEHSKQKDEVVDRSINETNSFSHRHPACEQSEDIDEEFHLYEEKTSSETQAHINSSAQQSHSKSEALGKPCDILTDSSSPSNTEAYSYLKNTPPPSQDRSVLADKCDVPQTGYSHSFSARTAHGPSQPMHVLQSQSVSQGVSQQSDSSSLTPADGGVCVKAEPIVTDLDSPKSENTAQTYCIPGTISGTQTPRHTGNLQQTEADRILCASSPSAMSEDFKLLIIENIIERGGDVNSGLVPHGTFNVISSYMNVSSRVVENLWYKYVFPKSLYTTNRARSGAKKKISTPELEFIAKLRTGNPNITEREIKLRLKEDLNVEVSQPTINRAIRQQLTFVKWNRKRWQIHE